ncbi:nicotinate phosphoribosyltransferase [Candidatus Poribacteria bacterium]|nr:nicotinate phosphoribosyltransferase [Candidatus Poribacteria bacterium]MYK20355.1 nicotinate phosphoribosyltransferase [Candidatus Poribacteria bacterium]
MKSILPRFHSSPPRSALLTEDNMSLFVDYYQLTMGQADFNAQNDAIITANYYVRKIPQGQYLVAAGLEPVVHYILNLRFTDATLDWLAQRGNLRADYLASLKDFRFDGSVFAVPEGTPVFPNEPIINVTGRSRDVQLFETYLLCVMNFQTLIATKASRIVQAARGRPVFDFGARRAHGRDAGILAARASFIGGAKGTSLVLAGHYFDIPYVGTMAHKFISERPTELEAFRDYATAFPNSTTLLIDTYDTIQGARNACIVAKEMEASGTKLRAVRLDSGNLLTLSKKVRRILDAHGLDYVQIIASHELDEFQIDTLLENGAPLDSFGVGTRLATGANFNSLTDEGAPSALGGVYKLVESDGKPVGKQSLDEPSKATVPGKKQVYRITDADGNYVKDRVTLWDEEVSEGQPLLIPIIQNGELVYDFPNLHDIQAYTTAALEKLPESHKRITGATPYLVALDPVVA